MAIPPAVPDNSVEASIRDALNRMTLRDPAEPNSTDVAYYQAGTYIGGFLSVKDIGDIAVRLGELGLGRPEFVGEDSGRLIFKWYQCLTCSSLPPIGRTFCFLEAGILAGAIRNVLQRRVEVRETRCWGTGFDYCQMEATVGAGNGPMTGEIPLPFAGDDRQFLIDLTFQAVQAVKEARRQRLAGKGSPEGGGVGGVGDALFELMPTGLAVVDRQGRIARVNRAWKDLLRVREGPSVGRPVSEVIPGSRATGVLATGTPEIWQAGPGKIILESPLYSGKEVIGVLGQVLSADSDLVRLLLQQMSRLEAEVELYRDELREIGRKEYRFNNIRSLSPEMQAVLAVASKAVLSNATVLILGESGTGKEVLARAIHNESARRTMPFVKVDCAAIPADLLESELFGYEEGAFTGARRGGKPGRFELARGGTLFLDEIGDMSPVMQAKVLRVLQDRECERLGGTSPTKLDVRVIAATNKNLPALVHEGKFREDLYYRLNVIRLELPPLRSRIQDIPLLIETILKRKGADAPGTARVSARAMRVLTAHCWPGNVRELENVLERAVVLSGGEIGPEHLPEDIKNSPGGGGAGGLREAKAAAEREAIGQAMRISRGDKAKAARILGLSRQGLYNKLARYGLDGRDPRSPKGRG